MNKKDVAINTQLLFFLVLVIVFVGLSICWLTEEGIGLGILFGVFGLLLLLISLISPMYFVFSDEGVEIVYHFRQKEYIKWSDIRSITVRGGYFTKGDGLPCYDIAYPVKEKRPFFVVGEIQKTRKTKKLIEKYYKKKII